MHAIRGGGVGRFELSCSNSAVKWWQSPKIAYNFQINLSSNLVHHEQVEQQAVQEEDE